MEEMGCIADPMFVDAPKWCNAQATKWPWVPTEQKQLNLASEVTEHCVTECWKLICNQFHT